MKYKMFNSEMKYKSNWIEFETDDVLKYLTRYIWNEFKIYDADTCGEDIIEIVLIDENSVKTFYEFEYSWYINRNPEWELIDEVVYKIKDSVKFKYPDKNRDWLFK